jgi:hypothetical protein
MIVYWNKGCLVTGVAGHRRDTENEVYYYSQTGQNRLGVIKYIHFQNYFCIHSEHGLGSLCIFLPKNL